MKVQELTVRQQAIYDYIVERIRTDLTNKGIVMKVQELTVRQQEIYDFIVEKIKGGLPPTVREIGRRCDINSPNGVACHLDALVKKGAITRDARSSRAIRLVHTEPTVCPQCGHEYPAKGCGP